ncbi:hypothetical protein T12_14321, partial [Trichinella patagoniensis]
MPPCSHSSNGKPPRPMPALFSRNRPVGHKEEQPSALAEECSTSSAEPLWISLSRNSPGRHLGFSLPS